SGTWAARYTASPRTVARRTPAGRQASSVVEAKGNAVRMNTPGRVVDTIQYDTQGRAKQVTRGDRTYTLNYDPDGNLAQIDLPDGRIVAATYDALDRTTAIVLPDRNQIRLGYELGGRRGLVTPPRPPHPTLDIKPGTTAGPFVSPHN